MTSSLNCFMDKGLLFLEIGLQIKDAFCTATGCIGITGGLLALHQQSGSQKSTFGENLLHPLWFVWIFQVVGGKIHLLCDLVAQCINVPSISECWLRSTRIITHIPGQQCIGSINAMPLRVVHHDQGLISRAMKSLKIRV